MKRNFQLFIAGVLSLSAMNASAFNNSYFKGTYAFRLSGDSSIVKAGEARTVSAGVLTADGKGHLFGHGTFRSAGITCVGSIKGAYTVNTDGTGSISSVVATGTPGCFPSVLDLAIVLHDDGDNFEAANVENDYMSGTLSRQRQTKFTNNDLKGAYALRIFGTSSIVRVNESQTVGVGLLNADGHGNVTGSGMLRSAGISCRGTFSGIYTITADGTGVLATNFNTSTPGCFTSVMDFTIALFNKGNGAEIANSENDYLAGSLHAQIKHG